MLFNSKIEISKSVLFGYNVEISLNKFETKMINGKVDNNVYHIEISNNADGKNIIEIHLKNIFEKTLDLEKGKKE